MDPTTTLITFMLQTCASVRSVQLVGSWDSFTKRYAMQRDVRRGHGQWRGCYSFKGIISDGDGQRSPKRNGGLKMGHTYWYYYELGDGTEIYDPKLPSTASCPFLPGQQVNLLYVPVEVSPLRERSASEGAVPVGMKTMNPEDKYLTPRPPPAIPKLPRLNTSPAMLNRKRSARSVSPKARSPWSARAIFHLKGPHSAHHEDRDRGRMPSSIVEKIDDISMRKVGPTSNPFESRHVRRIPGTMSSRDSSPLSHRRAPSREPSPLRHPVFPESGLNATAITIPDEILEECEDEDDDNFATCPDAEKALVTSLYPPHSRKLARLQTSTLDMKPLPMLPTESDFSPPLIAYSPSMFPSPLRVSGSSKAPRPQLLVSHSHFSVDTISTLSPTDSQFSNASSISGSYDEEDVETSAEDSLMFTPPPGLLGDGAGRLPNEGFHYSLPHEEDFGSELTIRKTIIAEATGKARDVEPGIRSTFGLGSGGGLRRKDNGGVEVGTVLDQFLADMGYLSDVIVGKAA